MENIRRIILSGFEHLPVAGELVQRGACNVGRKFGKDYSYSSGILAMCRGPWRRNPGLTGSATRSGTRCIVGTSFDTCFIRSIWLRRAKNATPSKRL
ncbi:hypothetical protein [Tateyamaria omphalii]|uniref:hypothetical protein n=1 Tax=Tateyamaria omphalii TaxID=299262 RepID=UPI0035713943